MSLLKSLRNVAMAAVLFSVGVANAATYQFNLTGGYTASWTLNSTVSPDVVYDGEGFILEDIDGNFPGSLINFVDLSFYSTAIGGGLEILDYYGDTLLLSTDGFQLYTGSEDSPTFRLGTFALTEYQGTETYTLTVTDLDAVPPPSNDVPEPATGALLFAGLGLMAAARKRRNR